MPILRAIDWWMRNPSPPLRLRDLVVVDGGTADDIFANSPCTSLKRANRPAQSLLRAQSVNRALIVRKICSFWRGHPETIAKIATIPDLLRSN